MNILVITAKDGQPSVVIVNFKLQQDRALFSFCSKRDVLTYKARKKKSERIDIAPSGKKV